MLESITKVLDQQVTKTGKVSSFFFFLLSFHEDRTITAKAIATSQTSEQVLFARAAVSISVEMFDDWIYNFICHSNLVWLVLRVPSQHTCTLFHSENFLVTL